jgi:hypothetical protein
MASDVTLLGSTVRGSKTLVANFFGQGGKGLHLHIRGYAATLNGTPYLKLGATTVWTASAITAATVEWELDAIITCYTTGATGTVRTAAVFTTFTNAGAWTRYSDGSYGNRDGDVVIDTTAALAIDFGINTTSLNAYTTHFYWAAID